MYTTNAPRRGVLGASPKKILKIKCSRSDSEGTWADLRHIRHIFKGHFCKDHTPPLGAPPPPRRPPPPWHPPSRGGGVPWHPWHPPWIRPWRMPWYSRESVPTWQYMYPFVIGSLTWGKIRIILRKIPMISKISINWLNSGFWYICYIIIIITCGIGIVISVAGCLIRGKRRY